MTFRVRCAQLRGKDDRAATMELLVASPRACELGLSLS